MAAHHLRPLFHLYHQQSRTQPPACNYTPLSVRFTPLLVAAAPAYVTRIIDDPPFWLLSPTATSTERTVMCVISHSVVGLHLVFPYYSPPPSQVFACLNPFRSPPPSPTSIFIHSYTFIPITAPRAYSIMRLLVLVQYSPLFSLSRALG